jgi:hypothetical protein
MGQRALVASQAKKAIIGRTKEQVLGCMGVPQQHEDVGETEVWSYTSGGDTVTLGFAGSSYSERKYCTVSIVMTGGRVSTVNYTGRTGTKDEQCAFAVKNCIQ